MNSVARIVGLCFCIITTGCTAQDSNVNSNIGRPDSLQELHQATNGGGEKCNRYFASKKVAWMDQKCTTRSGSVYAYSPSKGGFENGQGKYQGKIGEKRVTPDGYIVEHQWGDSITKLSDPVE
jgi:hypothetical protein